MKKDFALTLIITTCILISIFLLSTVRIELQAIDKDLKNMDKNLNSIVSICGYRG